MLNNKFLILCIFICVYCLFQQGRPIFLLQSHDDHSGDEMCDCDSVDGIVPRLNSSIGSNGAGPTVDMGGHDYASNIPMSHHHQLPTNHPLNALGSFMGIGSLHSIPNLQHNDVLEKLKMQVRDMKVGLMDQEHAVAHAAAFGSNVLATSMNTAFTLPPTTMSSYTHAAQSLAASAGNNINSSGGQSVTNVGHNNFSFTSPTTPCTKDGNLASSSSTSSETSNSSQQNNGWSFEEQYKQVRQNLMAKIVPHPYFRASVSEHGRNIDMSGLHYPSSSPSEYR